MIDSPDHTSYLLVFDPATSSGETPLFSKEAFKTMAELKLSAATMAVPLVYGRSSPERILRQPGIYKVTLADVLQSDINQKVYHCTIRVKPTR
jgi:hypothetical protein